MKVVSLRKLRLHRKWRNSIEYQCCSLRCQPVHMYSKLITNWVDLKIPIGNVTFRLIITMCIIRVHRHRQSQTDSRRRKHCGPWSVVRTLSGVSGAFYRIDKQNSYDNCSFLLLHTISYRGTSSLRSHTGGDHSVQKQMFKLRNDIFWIRLNRSLKPKLLVLCRLSHLFWEVFDFVCSQVVELLSMEDVDLTPEQIQDIVDLLEKESRVRQANQHGNEPT